MHVLNIWIEITLLKISSIVKESFGTHCNIGISRTLGCGQGKNNILFGDHIFLFYECIALNSKFRHNGTNFRLKIALT